MIDAIGILNSDTSFDTYDKTVSTDFFQMSPLAGEQALRQRAPSVLRDAMNKVVDDPVVQVPQAHVSEKTVEIAQLDVFEKIVETPEIQTDHSIRDRIQQRNVEQIIDTPILPVVEEQAEASKVFSQNRVQQSSMEQTISNPAISLAEKTVEMPHQSLEENTLHPSSEQCTRSSADTWVRQASSSETHVGSCSVSNFTCSLTGECPVSRSSVEDMMYSTLSSPKQVPGKIADTPDVAQHQVGTAQNVRADKAVIKKNPVKKCLDMFAEIAGKKDDQKKFSEEFGTGRKREINTSKFGKEQGNEVLHVVVDMPGAAEHRHEVMQRQVPNIQSTQKTVEVPRVQFIDRVVDDPAVMQRETFNVEARELIEDDSVGGKQQGPERPLS